MVSATVKRYLPNRALRFGRKLRKALQDRQIASGPIFSKEDLRDIVTNLLSVGRGDVVFVHSSLRRLNLSFPFFQILSILQDAVGKEGTLLFPTFPGRLSYDVLRSGERFDVLTTPSFMGALSELSRRMPGAIRSLHPTKSVCAIGPLAELLCAGHENSPYPFDAESPFGKLIDHGGKVIGIGVSTMNMSFVHCVDDFLKDRFPVKTYHDQLFAASCLDRSGSEVIVETYAHDREVMQATLRIPRFLRKHIAHSLCEDSSIGGVPFFRADALPLFQSMRSLAEQRTTIYAKRHLRQD